MKMRLSKKINFKNIKIDFTMFKKIFTYRNLLIFLISFLAVNLIIGIIFYINMKEADKLIINSNIKNYFIVLDNYDYLALLKGSLTNNIGNSLIIWLLGISVIGIVVIIFIYFAESFSIGISLSSIFQAYKGKGIIGIISYLFPSKIAYLFMLFLVTFYALRFSLKIIRYLIFKEDIDLRLEFKKYCKSLLIIILLAIIVSIFEVFLNPLMNRLFTLFIK